MPVRARERLISIADGYFDTLQRNDGTLYTQFHPDCNRVENGTRTTNNPAVGFTSVGALGCEEQFKLGNYRYDSALRGRRFPLVDEERGLVLASGFIDHSGELASYTLTDGRVINSRLRYPHSFYLLELFHIEDGMIRQIEAVFDVEQFPTEWHHPGCNKRREEGGCKRPRRSKQQILISAHVFQVAQDSVHKKRAD